MCIIDSQSVKNTDTAMTEGYDGGKKVSGSKRHIAVDTRGIPVAVTVTPANIHDRTAALTMLEQSSGHLASVTAIMADGGYRGKIFADAVRDRISAEVIIAKRSELHSFKVIPKRWIVERSFAWLEKCRRLYKNCERYLRTIKQMIILAFVALLMRRL